MAMCQNYWLALVFVATVGLAVEPSTVQQVEVLLSKRNFTEAERILSGIPTGRSEDGNELFARLNNLRAACYYMTLRPALAKSTWELAATQGNSFEKTSKQIWENRLIFAVDTLDVQLVDVLVRARPAESLSAVARNAIEVFTGKTNGIVGNPGASSLDLMLTLDANRNAGASAVSSLEISIVENQVSVGGTKRSMREDEVAQVALFLKRYDMAERLLRIQIQREAGSAPQLPRSDRALLRLSRLLMENGEYYMSDVFIRDADSFIVRVYGEASPLRVWPIEEKIRLYQFTGHIEAAKSLAQSAISQYPNFASRLNALIKPKEIIP